MNARIGTALHEGFYVKHPVDLRKLILLGCQALAIVEHVSARNSDVDSALSR